jgi:hypothetical protein
LTAFGAVRRKYEISDAPERLDLDVVNGSLATSCWSPDSPGDLPRAIDNSLNFFGLYKETSS